MAYCEFCEHAKLIPTLMGQHVYPRFVCGLDCREKREGDYCPKDQEKVYKVKLY